MAASLSHSTGIGVMEVRISSHCNWLGQHNSRTSLPYTSIFTSVDDKEMVTCFLHFYMIIVLLRKITNPLTDFSTLEIRGPIKITISKKVKVGGLAKENMKRWFTFQISKHMQFSLRMRFS